MAKLTAESQVEITGARVTVDAAEVALIEAITIGGGVQVVTVDGIPEERVHPVFRRFHVRLLSPDRIIPDQLLEADTYEEACALALKYAAKRAEHAAQVDALAADLQM
jgi:hypothetical protein